MQRRSSFFAALLVSLILFELVWDYSVFASRVAVDLASSRNGSSSPVAAACVDDATPFAVALNGNVTLAAGSCSFTSDAYTYPNYILTLQPQDKSFSLTVTPILWENGGASPGGSRETILHLEF